MNYRPTSLYKLFQNKRLPAWACPWPSHHQQRPEFHASTRVEQDDKREALETLLKKLLEDKGGKKGDIVGDVLKSVLEKKDDQKDSGKESLERMLLNKLFTKDEDNSGDRKSTFQHVLGKLLENNAGTDGKVNKDANTSQSFEEFLQELVKRGGEGREGKIDGLEEKSEPKNLSEPDKAEGTKEDKIPGLDEILQNIFKKDVSEGTAAEHNRDEKLSESPEAEKRDVKNENKDELEDMLVRGVGEFLKKTLSGKDGKTKDELVNDLEEIVKIFRKKGNTDN